MTKDIGPQYAMDDAFKAAARLHQSIYRSRVLNVAYLEYGNRLTDVDGRALLNYYDGLGVRKALRQRYPLYSQKRDADLLRSEHIPFNMLAPLANRPELTQRVVRDAFGFELQGPYTIRLEWAPQPKEKYLDDLTAFDTYIQGVDQNGRRIGIGIEVKYTERGYRIGKSEARRVNDPDSTYWATTRQSGLFVDAPGGLSEDDLRQIWRNHLLGLAMIREGDIAGFVSVTLYPSGNAHFTHALKTYRDRLKPSARNGVRGCTFEQFIDCLCGDHEIKAWRQYLRERYLVGLSATQQISRSLLQHPTV